MQLDKLGDQRIVDLKDKLAEKYANRKTWELLLNNQERDLTLVSREITRRTMEVRPLKYQGE